MKRKPEPRRVSRGVRIEQPNDQEVIVIVQKARNAGTSLAVQDTRDVILKARKGGRRWLIWNGGGRAVELKGKA
jgi:hypothetical protein